MCLRSFNAPENPFISFIQFKAHFLVAKIFKNVPLIGNFQKNWAYARKSYFPKKGQKSHLFSSPSTSTISTNANSVNFAETRQKLPKICQKLAQSECPHHLINVQLRKKIKI
jgi:hypothetical protein